VPTEPWFGDGKAACTGLIGRAAIRDNGHINDKLMKEKKVQIWLQQKFWLNT